MAGMEDFEQPEDIEELLPFMEDGLEEFEEEPMESSFPECIAVDCIPKVDSAKLPRLLGVLKKIFEQLGPVLKLDVPMGDNGVSCGFAFIQFGTAQAATLAVDKVNGYKLDKTHTFNVIPYSELARLASLPATYEAPPPATFKPPPDLDGWLSDSSGRDQFVLRFAAAGREETVVNWGEANRAPTSFYGGEREKSQGLAWCEREVKWSPKGSYLGTLHPRGVALWGGPDMLKQGRFAHDYVNRLSFSPCERYMLTCNFQPPSHGESTVKFWNIAEGRVIRVMPLSFVLRGGGIGEGGEEIPGQFVPNLFKWSADGSYVAHLAPEGKATDAPNGLIKVYTLPSMQLLDAKSLRCQGVMDFEWSPTDNSLAYWAREEGNSPARVCLVAIPSRKDLRQKNLFSVTECTLVWHPKGDFLAVKVMRHTKSKKTHFNNLELFRIREDQVPVETLNDIKSMILRFAWEPSKGAGRFAILTNDGPKPSVTLYDMHGQSGGKPECTWLKTLPNRACNQLFWSPAGGALVLAGLTGGGDDSSGVFEFYDADALPDSGAEREHYRANAAEWDPSGRVFMTAVSQPLEGMVYKFQMDNGYHLWTFQGESFFEKSMEKFYSFSWRPRPPCLLDEAEKKAVVKNLRKFERKFERADREQKKKRELKNLIADQRMRTDFRQRIAARKARNYDGIRADKVAARYGYDEDDESNYVVETVQREVVISTKEEVVAVM